jgi:hypothetical protein
LFSCPRDPQKHRNNSPLPPVSCQICGETGYKLFPAPKRKNLVLNLCNPWFNFLCAGHRWIFNWVNCVMTSIKEQLCPDFKLHPRDKLLSIKATRDGASHVPLRGSVPNHLPWNQGKIQRNRVTFSRI